MVVNITDKKTNGMKDLGAKAKILPVLIYGELFEFKMTRKAMQELVTKKEEIAKFEKEMKKKDLEDEKVQIDILRYGFDLILGSGAFDRIYQHMDDEVALLETFEAMTEYIKESLEDYIKEIEKGKLQKIIDAKKQKK